MAPQVIVVGAGVAGLACAQALSAAGREVLVLERARGVGGRCATRRIGETPLDFGVAFLHGRDPEFLAAVRGTPGTLLEGWPSKIQGTGMPCQPEAFAAGEIRLAFAEGVSAFPKHLARGLQVRTGARVEALEPAGRALALRLEGGERLAAETVALALAPEQALELLATLPAPPVAVRSASAVLDMIRSHPCLTVLALYPAGAPRPGWHVAYPERSSVVQLVSHESSKRRGAGDLALVVQAHAAWSTQNVDEPAWPDALLAETARLLGDWAARPETMEPHAWRFARGDVVGKLAAPLWLALDGGARLGVTGDRFGPGGGVQAAWIAGRRLAVRILGEERP